MPIARVALLALAALCLFAGIAGGLARLGVPLAAGSAAVDHGTLMTGGFLGSVISLERAVALGKRFAFLAPLASAGGALLLVCGAREAGLALLLAAPLLLAAACAAILRRQAQPHIALLLVAALAWGIGSALGLASAAPNAIAAWWFAFLVLTIAAERLEMTRLARRPAVATPLFHASVAVLIAGACIAPFEARAGGALFGAGLAAVAAWLGAFDIARRTVRSGGLARYCAVALLAGYAWLGLAGVAWAAMSLADPSWRDTALHAVGIGFVFSMIFAHAPIIVPAIVRVRVRFHPAFYVPLALLHLSLLARVAGEAVGFAARRPGGVLNAAAIVLFALTLVALSRRAGEGAASP